METKTLVYVAYIEIYEGYFSLETEYTLYNIYDYFNSVPEPEIIPDFANIELEDSFFNLLKKRCITENHFCSSEIDDYLRHREIYPDFYIDCGGIEVIFTIDINSNKCIDFHISDLIRHNNIGFDHLYDDSEYPNDF